MLSSYFFRLQRILFIFITFFICLLFFFLLFLLFSFLSFFREFQSNSQHVSVDICSRNCYIYWIKMYVWWSFDAPTSICIRHSAIHSGDYRTHKTLNQMDIIKIYRNVIVGGWWHLCTAFHHAYSFHGFIFQFFPHIFRGFCFMSFVRFGFGKRWNAISKWNIFANLT